MITVIIDLTFFCSFENCSTDIVEHVNLAKYCGTYQIRIYKKDLK